jgi:hypothetical protein
MATILSHRCRRRVINWRGAVNVGCPLYPGSRTDYRRLDASYFRRLIRLSRL